MMCERCGSQSVEITQEMTGSKISTKGPGCLWSIGRLILIFLTLGLWLIVGKRKATSHTRYSYQSVGICQKCAYKFNIV